MLCTDIDDKNVVYARSNITANDHLKERVEVVHVDPKGPILPVDRLEKDGSQDAKGYLATFTMCNPPFYWNEEDMAAKASMKDRPPNAINTGTTLEMVTDGGEVGFTERVIMESTVIGDRIKWYTTLLGHRESAQKVLALIKKAMATHWIGVPISTGGPTKRYIVAWSFDVFPPPQRQGFKCGFTCFITHKERDKNLLTINSATMTPFASSGSSLQADGISKDSTVVWKALAEFSSEFDVRYSKHTGNDWALCAVDGNTWSRHAQRQRQRRLEQQESADDTRGKSNVDAFKPLWSHQMVVKAFKKEGEALISLHWVKGTQFKLFESFVGKVRAELKERCSMLANQMDQSP